MLATVVWFVFFFTFLVHCLTVMTSSDMTMSTHLVQGSLIFPICLFTMVSKAISGVKRPVLPARERHRISRRDHRASRRAEEEEKRREEEEEEEWVKEKSVSCAASFSVSQFSSLKTVWHKTGKKVELWEAVSANLHVHLRVFYIFPQLIK